MGRTPALRTLSQAWGSTGRAGPTQHDTTRSPLPENAQLPPLYKGLPCRLGISCGKIYVKIKCQHPLSPAQEHEFFNVGSEGEWDRSPGTFLTQTLIMPALLLLLEAKNKILLFQEKSFSIVTPAKYEDQSSHRYCKNACYLLSIRTWWILTRTNSSGGTATQIKRDGAWEAASLDTVIKSSSEVAGLSPPYEHKAALQEDFPESLVQVHNINNQTLLPGMPDSAI